MKLSLAGWLLLGLIAMTVWAGVATFQWLTDDAECKQESAERGAQAQADENDRSTKADREATGVFDRVQSSVRTDITSAQDRTAKRSASIRAAAVAGECRMPAMPSLRDAVKEARDAAAD